MNVQNRTATSSSKPKKKSHTLRNIFLVLCALLVIVYGGGVYYFSGHFLPDCYINEQQMRCMNLTDAESVFTEDYESHKIALVEKDRREYIDPRSVKAVIRVGNQISDHLNNQKKWLWPAHIRGREDTTIKLDVTYDEKELQQTVNALECFKKENIIKPESAYIKAGETQFEIVPEVPGTTVVKKSLIKRIGECLATCVTEINFEQEELYKKPKYISTDKKVTKALKTANKYAKSEVVYDFEYTEVHVNYEKFKDWIVIDDKFNVYFSDTALANYVEKLCRDFNTIGSSRQFTTHNGNTINVYDGDYGWKIYYDKEFTKLNKDLKSGKTIEREPIYSYKAMCRKSANDDIGGSYVEVDISDQMVYLYKGGSCIMSSAVVTGNHSRGFDTHKGIYSITYKQSPATLEGQGYSSPVTYWMPFNGGQGLHDAAWRGNFGGSIYMYNGSHGCVNCPTSAARTLYKTVEAGWPVIVH